MFFNLLKILSHNLIGRSLFKIIFCIFWFSFYLCFLALTCALHIFLCKIIYVSLRLLLNHDGDFVPPKEYWLLYAVYAMCIFFYLHMSYRSHHLSLKMAYVSFWGWEYCYWILQFLLVTSMPGLPPPSF